LKASASRKEEVTRFKATISTKLEVALLKVIQQVKKYVNRKYIDIDLRQAHQHKKVLFKLGEVFSLQLATKVWSHFDFFFSSSLHCPSLFTYYLQGFFLCHYHGLFTYLSFAREWKHGKVYKNSWCKNIKFHENVRK
jgi:hypothetical protein